MGVGALLLRIDGRRRRDRHARIRFEHEALAHRAGEGGIAHPVGMTDEGTGYSIAIRYRYTVAGAEYTSTSLNLVEWSLSWRSTVERKLESLQSRVDEHGRILIHHHPTQPHRSVVNAGVGVPELAFLTGMVVWTSIVGLVMLL